MSDENKSEDVDSGEAPLTKSVKESLKKASWAINYNHFVIFILKIVLNVISWSYIIYMLSH